MVMVMGVVLWGGLGWPRMGSALMLDGDVS
jgi:hypothetical protein